MPVAYDVAVIVPTVLRPTLGQALHSVYGQAFDGRIQLLIGIDVAHGDRAGLDRLVGEAPGHVDVLVFDPGYSTSQRHGGLHAAGDCGALRTVLSYMAHAPALAHLDDDNWWAPDHLSTLRQAMTGKDWAFSLRSFVEPTSGATVALDEWDSVGPGRGIHADSFGGFVDTNCMMLDAVRCEPVHRLWSLPHPGSRAGRAADRNVFAALAARHPWGETGAATVFYRMNPADIAHRRRLAEIGRRQATDFPGFRQFLAGDFAAAAESFTRVVVLAPGNAYGAMWRYAARARVGEGAAALAELETAMAGIAGDGERVVLDLVRRGGKGLAPARLAAQGDMPQVMRIAFFAGQAALAAGTPDLAAAWLEIAARGREGQPEAAAARAELCRLGEAAGAASS